MKPQTTKNVIVDEAKKITYVVMACRVLTDGEVYRDIRLALLQRGGQHPPSGETLVINSINKA